MQVSHHNGAAIVAGITTTTTATGHGVPVGHGSDEYEHHLIPLSPYKRSHLDAVLGGMNGERLRVAFLPILLLQLARRRRQRIMRSAAASDALAGGFAAAVGSAANTARNASPSTAPAGGHSPHRSRAAGHTSASSSSRAGAGDGEGDALQQQSLVQLAVASAKDSPMLACLGAAHIASIVRLSRRQLVLEGDVITYAGESVQQQGVVLCLSGTVMAKTMGVYSGLSSSSSHPNGHHSSSSYSKAPPPPPLTNTSSNGLAPVLPLDVSPTAMGHATSRAVPVGRAHGRRQLYRMGFQSVVEAAAVGGTLVGLETTIDGPLVFGAASVVAGVGSAVHLVAASDCDVLFLPSHAILAAIAAEAPSLFPSIRRMLLRTRKSLVEALYFLSTFLLRQSWVLECLSRPTLERLRSRLVPLCFLPGDVIAEGGVPARGLYFVRRGHVLVGGTPLGAEEDGGAPGGMASGSGVGGKRNRQQRATVAATASSSAAATNTLSPPTTTFAIFGERSLVFGENPIASITAGSICDVWFLPRAEYEHDQVIPPSERSRIVQRGAAIRIEALQRWRSTAEGAARLEQAFARALGGGAEGGGEGGGFCTSAAAADSLSLQPQQQQPSFPPPYFSGAPRAVFAVLAHLAVPRVFPAYSTIGSQSQWCDGITVITRGRASQQFTAVAGLRGGEQSLAALYERGQCVGSSCVIAHRWPHTVCSVTMVIGWFVPRHDVRRVLAAYGLLEAAVAHEGAVLEAVQRRYGVKVMTSGAPDELLLAHRSPSAPLEAIIAHVSRPKPLHTFTHATSATSAVASANGAQKSAISNEAAAVHGAGGDDPPPPPHLAGHVPSLSPAPAVHRVHTVDAAVSYGRALHAAALRAVVGCESHRQPLLVAGHPVIAELTHFKEVGAGTVGGGPAPTAAMGNGGGGHAVSPPPAPAAAAAEGLPPGPSALASAASPLFAAADAVVPQFASSTLAEVMALERLERLRAILGDSYDPDAFASDDDYDDDDEDDYGYCSGRSSYTPSEGGGDGHSNESPAGLLSPSPAAPPPLLPLSTRGHGLTVTVVSPSRGESTTAHAAGGDTAGAAVGGSGFSYYSSDSGEGSSSSNSDGSHEGSDGATTAQRRRKRANARKGEGGGGNADSDAPKPTSTPTPPHAFRPINAHSYAPLLPQIQTRGITEAVSTAHALPAFGGGGNWFLSANFGGGGGSSCAASMRAGSVASLSFRRGNSSVGRRGGGSSSGKGVGGPFNASSSNLIRNMFRQGSMRREASMASLTTAGQGRGGSSVSSPASPFSPAMMRRAGSSFSLSGGGGIPPPQAVTVEYDDGADMLDEALEGMLLRGGGAGGGGVDATDGGLGGGVGPLTDVKVSDAEQRRRRSIMAALPPQQRQRLQSIGASGGGGPSSHHHRHPTQSPHSAHTPHHHHQHHHHQQHQSYWFAREAYHRHQEALLNARLEHNASVEGRNARHVVRLSSHLRATTRSCALGSGDVGTAYVPRRRSTAVTSVMGAEASIPSTRANTLTGAAVAVITPSPPPLALATAVVNAIEGAAGGINSGADGAGGESQSGDTHSSRSSRDSHEGSGAADDGEMKNAQASGADDRHLSADAMQSSSMPRSPSATSAPATAYSSFSVPPSSAPSFARRKRRSFAARSRKEEGEEGGGEGAQQTKGSKRGLIPLGGGDGGDTAMVDGDAGGGDGDSDEGFASQFSFYLRSARSKGTLKDKEVGDGEAAEGPDRRAAAEVVSPPSASRRSSACSVDDDGGDTDEDANGTDEDAGMRNAYVTAQPPASTTSLLSLAVKQPRPQYSHHRMVLVPRPPPGPLAHPGPTCSSSSVAKQPSSRGAAAATAPYPVSSIPMPAVRRSMCRGTTSSLVVAAEAGVAPSSSSSSSQQRGGAGGGGGSTATPRVMARGGPPAAPVGSPRSGGPSVAVAPSRPTTAPSRGGVGVRRTSSSSYNTYAFH